MLAKSHGEVGQIYAGQNFPDLLNKIGGRENPCLAWICPTPAQTGGFSASGVGLRCIPNLREASRSHIRRPTSTKAPSGTPDARPPRSLRVGFFPPDLREKAEVGKIPAGPILARPGPPVVLRFCLQMGFPLKAGFPFLETGFPFVEKGFPFLKTGFPFSKHMPRF